MLASDDPDLRSRYAQRLRDAGHEVREAEDGGQALALVRACAPQLLLLENWLPIFNALEVLGRLRSTPPAAGLTAVVLSNDNDADSRLEGSALGVADWWRTDLSPDELCGRVEEVTRSARRSFEPGG